VTFPTLRTFKGFEEIVDELSRAWNVFISDIDRIKELCSRDWIKLVE
jgi:hypothetical protein